MASPNQPQTKGTVLIIDADAEIGGKSKTELGKLGYEVFVAANLSKAQMLLESSLEKRALNLLIVDVSLPQMSGYEVVRRLSGVIDARKLPLVMMAKYPSPEDRFEMQSVGAQALLQKPVAPKEVEDVLEKVRIKKLKEEIGKIVFTINHT